MAVARCAVLPSSVSPSGSGMNGLGAASRESGHRRVPAPPERITGTIGRRTRRCPFRVGGVLHRQWHELHGRDLQPCASMR